MTTIVKVIIQRRMAPWALLQTIYDARNERWWRIGIAAWPTRLPWWPGYNVYNPTRAVAFNLCVQPAGGLTGENLTYLGPQKVSDDAGEHGTMAVTGGVWGATDDRESDLVLHLVSPQGTRIVLAENRGGFDTNGFGSGSIVTNAAPPRLSGGFAADTNVIASTKNEGIIIVTNDFQRIPDQMHIYYDGALIYDTGLINGQGNFRSIMVGQFDDVIIIMNRETTVTRIRYGAIRPRLSAADTNLPRFTDNTIR